MSSTEANAPAKPPTDELPQLSTYTAETEEDRIEGLRLVADSVAQQRQVASKVMLFHPVSLAAYFVVVAIAAQYMLRWYEDKMMLVTTIGGISMTFLILIRWMTGGYIGMAEDINMDWLGDDRLIVVKWGEDVIGSLVLGWADNDAAKKRGRRRRGKAVVRAWTVKLKYRGKGIGEGLLEEAVKVAGERGADGIVFDADHASKFTCVHILGSSLTVCQTPSAYSPPSSTATSASKTPKPRRLYKRLQTQRATSASVKARPLGAAGRHYIFSLSLQQMVVFCFHFIAATSFVLDDTPFLSLMIPQTIVIVASIKLFSVPNSVSSPDCQRHHTDHIPES
jgi:GNAT superfamily N-acetyltransferase